MNVKCVYVLYVLFLLVLVIVTAFKSSNDGDNLNHNLSF